MSDNIDSIYTNYKCDDTDLNNINTFTYRTGMFLEPAYIVYMDIILRFGSIWFLKHTSIFQYRVHFSLQPAIKYTFQTVMMIKIMKSKKHQKPEIKIPRRKYEKEKTVRENYFPFEKKITQIVFRQLLQI